MTGRPPAQEGRVLITHDVRARGCPFATPPTMPHPRHWYIDDGAGYCRACGLPERNTRVHAPRAA